MHKNDVIVTMNLLIETCKDGEHGFRTCADGVKSARVKRLLDDAAQRCAEAAAELEAKVRGLGGDFVESGSVTGSLHRAWINIKSTIPGMDEAAVLAECERGEDIAKRAYETALEKDLPADVRAIIARQYQGVKKNRDRVRKVWNTAS